MQITKAQVVHDSSSPPHPLQRPPVIGLVLMVLMALAIAFIDPRATVVNDTGGKTATLASMVADDDWSMDIGYWAADADPDGSLAPYFATSRYGDQWVQVTTIPMVLAARPLYAAGGHRAALLLPMLGVVMTALGAGALHRQLGDRTGAIASWVVGVAGPAFIYGLDFWEHSVGLALMVWGALFLLRAIDGRGHPAGSSAISGLLFGAAATMRQEALIYGFVAGLVLAWSLRRNLRSLVPRGGAMAAGAGLILVLNRFLEQVVLGGDQRATRAAGVLGGREIDWTGKFYDVLLEISGLAGVYTPEILFPSGLFIVGLAWLGAAIGTGRDLRNPSIVVGLAYLFLAIELIAHGLGFVPGMLVVSPFAGLALLARGPSKGASELRLLALGAVPLVAYFQYPGGVAPQWGGRLLLTTSVLLTVVGVDLVVRARSRVLPAVVGAGLVVGMAGVLWVIQRTNTMGDTVEQLASIEAPVTVFWDPVFAREAGPMVLDEKWLTALGPEGREELPGVLHDLGVDEFVYVVPGDLDLVSFEGFSEASTEQLVVFEGFELSLIRYVR